MKNKTKILLCNILLCFGFALFIEGFFDLTFETALGFLPINSFTGIMLMGLAYTNIQIIRLKHKEE